MPPTLLFANRRLRIGYWDSDAKFTNMQKMNFERSLSTLADITLEELKEYDAPNLPDFDVIIIAAPKLSEDRLLAWLRGLVKRMQHPRAIWVPAMIVAPISYQTLAPAMIELTMNNWYFDVVDPESIASVPIRIANLVRIHDHIKELSRYHAELRQLDAKVTSLEQQLTSKRETP
jgi:hypothetical protein